MTDVIFFSVALPAVLGAVAITFAQRLWHASQGPGPGSAWGYALAVAVVFAAAFYSEAGLPGWPLLGWHTLLVPVAAALALSLILLRFSPTGVRLAFAAMVVAVATALACRFPEVDTRPWRVVLGGAILASVACWRIATGERDGLTVPANAMLLYATLSILLLESRFAKASLVCGALSAFNGMILAAGLCGRPVRTGWGGLLVPAALVPAIALCGYGYDYDVVPRLSWVLAAAAPVGMAAVALITHVPPDAGTTATRPRINLRMLAPTSAILLACGGSLGLALIKTADGADSAGDYDEYGMVMPHGSDLESSKWKTQEYRRGQNVGC